MKKTYPPLVTTATVALAQAEVVSAKARFALTGAELALSSLRKTIELAVEARITDFLREEVAAAKQKAAELAEEYQTIRAESKGSTEKLTKKYREERLAYRNFERLSQALRRQSDSEGDSLMAAEKELRGCSEAFSAANRQVCELANIVRAETNARIQTALMLKAERLAKAKHSISRQH